MNVDAEAFRALEDRVDRLERAMAAMKETLETTSKLAQRAIDEVAVLRKDHQKWFR